MIALESIEDEGLVRLGDLRLRESPLVRQVHLGWERTSVETGSLGVELEVNGLRGLDAEDKLVAGDVLEDTLGDILELYADLDLRFVQG